MCSNPHIVKLLGACVEENHRLCVFDLMEWGNLRDLLDHRDPRLTWEGRVKAAIGGAKGLAYLHEGDNPAVVHRDFKSENLLLDRFGEVSQKTEQCFLFIFFNESGRFCQGTIVHHSSSSWDGISSQSSRMSGVVTC